MKISKALLARYAQKKCTEKERLFVENWLNSYETLDNVKEDGQFDKHKEEAWDYIAKTNGFGNSKVTSLSKTIFKYAAVACIIFGAFVSGRVSASSNPDRTIKSIEYEEHLYLTGGSDLQANLYGNRFKVKFRGTLQLYNASQKEQTIISGDSTFVLIPQRIYFLTGST